MAEAAVAIAGASAAGTGVLTLSSLQPAGLGRLAGRFGVRVVAVEAGAPIPGSYWGEPEAGLIGDLLYVRPDTPLHSALHELAHYVCMSARRRQTLDTNAGGSVIEECGVCYLQTLLADALDGFGRDRSLRDMDAWGYSFREGPAAVWFEGDGRDARDWLVERGLIDIDGRVLWRVRGD